MTRVQGVLAVVVAAAAVAASVPLGCRAVLGIEDRGDDTLTCDAYCTAVTKACKGKELQYVSQDACIGMCKTFPVGTLDDTSGNTLGCRLRIANNRNSGGEGDCTAMGPGGDGQCGTNCDGFCTGVASACPNDFHGLAECHLACARIPDAECPAFSVSPEIVPNFDSVQCRLYHVTAATLDPVDHCPHTLGEVLCVPAADGGVPCTDAGTSTGTGGGGSGGSGGSGSGGADAGGDGG